MKITSIVCVVATRSDDSTKFEEFFSFANHQQLIKDSVLKISQNYLKLQSVNFLALKNK
jgi:hypothetical protein